MLVKRGEIVEDDSKKTAFFAQKDGSAWA